ncbi:MAG: hypothetical protein V4541_00015 [Bacteroidota bacterium]
MFRNTIYLLLAAFIYSTAVYAQIDPQSLAKITDRMPASPDVSAIARYGDIPLNKSTGAVNYSLPLLSISAGKISYDFSLSYGAAGIKVDQTASRVGLGWALNGTGVISRTIMDEPDELSTPNVPPVNLAERSRAMLDFLERSVLQDDGYDNQPDEFSFNFNGYSGRFVFDNSGNIRQITKSTLKIEKDFLSTVYNFKITDQNGIVYYFGGSNATEYTKTLTYGLNCGSNRPVLNDGAPTAWYLIKIVHPQGKNPDRDNLQFVYTANTFTYYTSVSQTQIRTPTTTPLGGCPSSTRCPDLLENKTCVMQLQVNGYFLSQVTSSQGGQVILSYSSTGTRFDLPGDVALNSIELRSPANVMLKKFSLSYNHIQSLNPMSSPDAPTNTSVNYRMYLSGVLQSGQNNTTLGSYHFNYYSPNLLPARLSFSQDHYGFFNGQSNASFIGQAPTPLTPVTNNFVTANRSPSATVFGYGLLSSIRYPSGGKDSLVYEPHYALQDTLVEPPVTYYYGDVRGIGSRTVNSVSSGTFNIAYDQTGSLNYSCSESPGSEYEYDSIHNFGRIQLRDITAGVDLYYMAKIDPGTNVNTTVNFTAGHSYELITSAYGDIITMNSVLTYRAGSATHELLPLLVGGARLAKTISYDGATQLLYKRYLYTQLDGVSCSGQIVQPGPDYYSVLRNALDCGGTGSGTIDCGSYQCNYIIAHSNGISNQTASGSHIYYSSCLESLGDDNFAGGGNQRKFTVDAPDITAFTFIGEQLQDVPLTSRSWENGQEVYALDFKKNGTNVIKVQETFKTFTIDSINQFHQVKGYMVRKNFIAKCSSIPPAVPLDTEFNPFDGDTYTLTSAWRYQDSETTLSYDQDGLNPVTVVHQYAYNPATLLMSSDTQQLSNGETRVDQYWYSADYASISGLDPAQSTILAQLTTDGNIAAPVVVSKTINGGLTESTRVDYQYNGATSHIVTGAINSWNTAILAFEKRTDLSIYNDADQLTGTVKDGVWPAAYKWGYNGDYLITQVNNASPGEFYSENFEQAVGATTGAAHTGSKYTTTALVSFTRPNARSYVITYWYRSGGVWFMRPPQAYSASSFTMSGGDGYDDVAIYPIDAQLSSSTYDPLIGIRSQIDARGQTTYYEYDDLQRLKVIKDQNGDIIKTYTYHYRP